MKDRIERKMQQEMRHIRTEKLSIIDYTLAWEELEHPDEELTIIDPESGTALHFTIAHNGAFGREMN